MSSRTASTTAGATTSAPSQVQASANLGRSLGQFVRAFLPQIGSILRLLINNSFLALRSLKNILLGGMTVTAGGKPAVVVKGVGQN